MGSRTRARSTHLRDCHRPGLTGRPSIPEAAVIEPISRGVLDPPPSRGMTTPTWCPPSRRSFFTPMPFPLRPKTLYGAARFALGEI